MNLKKGNPSFGRFLDTSTENASVHALGATLSGVEPSHWGALFTLGSGAFLDPVF